MEQQELTPPPLPNLATITQLVKNLGSVSDQTRTNSLTLLHQLTKHHPSSRPLLISLDAIPYLTDALYSPSSSSASATATLLNLSIYAKEPLVSNGVIDALSHTLRNCKVPDAVQAAAATLHSLLVVEEYRSVIGEKRDVVFGLVEIVKRVDSHPRSVKEALKALFGIALFPPNRGTMIELGIVGALFGRVVKDGRVGIVEDTTAVIAQVAGCEESFQEFKRVCGIRVLVDLLDLGTGLSMRVKENAVGALLNLARFGGKDAVEDIREGVNGVLNGVKDVKENGSVKGRTKAMALFEIVDHYS